MVDALSCCEALHQEIENLTENELSALTCTVEALPNGLEMVKGLAEGAAAEIASLESRHGGNLYDPI